MIKIKKQTKIHKIIVSTLLKCIYKIENIGDSNPLNNGEYTNFIIKNFKNTQNKMHLFKPQKKCIEKLKSRFHNKDIHINNFGLSNTNLNQTIYKDKDGSGLSSLYKRNLDYYSIPFEEVEEIELRCAKKYIEDNNIQHINLLKIDVEGHELEVLSGFGDYLNSNMIDYIQFEYGGANIDSKTNLIDLFTKLTKRGFVLHKIMKTHIEPRKYSPKMENFVNQNYVAVSYNKI